jgi:outer membrane protein TolC
MKTLRLQSAVRRALTIAALAVCSTVASAQLSLSTVVDLAQKNDPRIKIALADVTKANAALAQARDAYIPTAAIQGGYGTSVGVPLSVPTVFSFSSQSLAFNFSQQDYVRAATAGLRSAELSLQDARDQAAEDAITTYLSLDNAEARQAAMVEEFGAANKLATIVQERLDAGQDTRLELLKSRRTAAQIHLLELRTEDEVATLNDHLTRLIGISGTNLATIATSIPEMPSPDQKPLTEEMSPGVRAAYANAKSKQQTAFGDARYRFRPQISFGLDFSYIDTSHTNYLDYYPGFQGKSRDAASIGISMTIPLYDRGHQAKAHEAAAEAVRARAEAENNRNQFLEGRFKLRHSTEELRARSEVSELDFELSQEQLKTVLIQLNGSGGDANATQLSPKDEQNARVQERQRFVELLEAQLDLRKAEVSLMRQNGTLDDWLRQALATPIIH